MAKKNKNAHIDHLGGVPLFAGLSRKDLERLAQLCNEVNVPAGKELVTQGSVGFECFVIVEGEAKVERNGHLLRTLSAGDYFGEMALLDKGPRSATITALSPMTVLVMTPREFSSALDDIKGLNTKIMAGLAKRIRELDQRLLG